MRHALALPQPHKNKNARPPRSTTFFLLKTLSDFVGVPFNNFYQILQYKSWIDV